MKKITSWIAASAAVLVLGTGLALTPADEAPAHTPSGSASCAGLALKASAYDGNKENKWEATIGDVTQSGTFGSSLSLLLPVPQENATTKWSYTIQAFNGEYKETKSGTVGPCGRTTITAPTLGVTSPDCYNASWFSPDFTKGTPAQNANGWEFDGGRIYLNAAPVFPVLEPTTYTATIQRVGPGFDPKYPNGTTVVGQTTQTLTLLPKIDEATCAGPQPETTYGEWQNGEWDCSMDAYPIYREVTSYTRAAGSLEWTAVVTKEYSTKPLTEEQIKSCVEVPASVFTEKLTEKIDCATKLYTGEKVFFQSDPVWNPETKAYDSFTEPFEINREPTSREATAEELAKECPVTVVTFIPPPALAHAGADVIGWYIAGAFLVALGVLLFLVVPRLRNKQ